MNPFTRNRRRRSQFIIDLLAQHPDGMEDVELWLETPWADRQLAAALKPLLHEGRVVSRRIPGTDPARRPRWNVKLAPAEEASAHDETVTVAPSEFFDELAASLDGPAVPNEATRDAFRRLGESVERRD